MKREFRNMTCLKCDIYLGGMLVGSDVMCPKCNTWQKVEKTKRKRSKK